MEESLAAVRLRSCGIAKLHFKSKYWHKIHSKSAFCDLTSTFDNLHKHCKITSKSLVHYGKMWRNNWFWLKQCFLSPRATGTCLLWFGSWWMRPIILIEIKLLQGCYFKKKQQRAHSSNLWMSVVSVLWIKWWQQLQKKNKIFFFFFLKIVWKVLLPNFYKMMHECD